MNQPKKGMMLTSTAIAWLNLEGIMPSEISHTGEE